MGKLLASRCCPEASDGEEKAHELSPGVVQHLEAGEEGKQIKEAEDEQ